MRSSSNVFVELTIYLFSYYAYHELILRNLVANSLVQTVYWSLVLSLSIRVVVFVSRSFWQH